MARAYTVIGVWLDDRPVPVGVIAGSHEVTGGDESEFEGGLWATSVAAETPEDAESKAVAEMKPSE